MNPFRSTSARFHKKLLNKTMAIGVILALMGTGMPYPIGQRPAGQRQKHGAGRGAKPNHHRDIKGESR